MTVEGTNPAYETPCLKASIFELRSRDMGDCLPSLNEFWNRGYNPCRGARTMLKVCSLLVSFAVFWLLSASCVAQTKSSFVPNCTPAVLDVFALPMAAPPLSVDGHIFVLELQGIGSAPCTLPEPAVDLLPKSDTNNNPRYVTNDSDDAGSNAHNGPKQLQPGGWAHILFAWISRAAPEISCDEYSGLRLKLLFHPNIEIPDEPSIEVRHLWIRACGPLTVSGYRLGRYNMGSLVPKGWLQWYGPASIANLKFPNQGTSSQIISGFPLLQLHAPAKRTMLGDSLVLRLNFPRRADSSCAFQLLRKRESTGATVISVQECPEVEAGPRVTVSRTLQPGAISLVMQNLDFLPSHLGPLSYDVVTQTDDSNPPLYARAHLDLVASDPAPPGQVPIIDPLPACTSSQLRIIDRPPVVADRLRTLRVYEATNTSAASCSLAGIPPIRFLDDKGMNQPFVPRPCPNCANELFAPRPNGRIDLHPTETAHFLVGATASDNQYCSQTKTVELTVAPGSQALPLPFDARDCGTLDISTWRQGTFDNDPMNARWEKMHNPPDIHATVPIPAECNKPELLAFGQPKMIRSSGQLQFGLSMATSDFLAGQPVPLFVWVDNPTDEPLSVMTCMDLDYFKAHEFDLYDAYGHRVLSKSQVKIQQQCKTRPELGDIYKAWSCTRNFPIAIPPHTCVTAKTYDFSATLTQNYDLPAGEYTVRPRRSQEKPEDACHPDEMKPFHKDPSTDTTFAINQP